MTVRYEGFEERIVVQGVFSIITIDLNRYVMDYSYSFVETKKRTRLWSNPLFGLKQASTGMSSLRLAVR